MYILKRHLMVSGLSWRALCGQKASRPLLTTNIDKMETCKKCRKFKKKSR